MIDNTRTQRIGEVSTTRSTRRKHVYAPGERTTKLSERLREAEREAMLTRKTCTHAQTTLAQEAQTRVLIGDPPLAPLARRTHDGDPGEIKLKTAEY